MSKKEARNIFSSLKYIIIDELHNLIHSKRGDLLNLNLARINSFCPNLIRVALSATLKDLNNGLLYFSAKKNAVIIENKEKKAMHLSIIKTKKEIPWVGYMPTYAINEIYNIISSLKTSIIFVNTRAQSEYVFQELWKKNKKKIKIAVHHGSLEKNIRLNIEKKMFEGKIQCVVATSSLELGIDWGSIDLIIQVGAPKGISRIIQRIGRSNHKINLHSKAILVPTNKFEYIECKACINAVAEFDIEEMAVKDGSLDVLAQHICGVASSEPFNLDILYKNIKTSYPYRKLKKKTFMHIINFVKDGGYSLKAYEEFSKIKKNSDGKFEMVSNKFIKKYRMNIGTIIDSDLINIYLKNKKLGKIEEYFVQNLSIGDTFLFAGEVLEYVGVNLKGILVKKTKSKNPKIPSYTGGRLSLSSKLASRVIKLINNYKEYNFPKEIKDWLNNQTKFSSLPPIDGLLIETFSRFVGRKKNNYLVAYTFQGRKTNQTLGIILINRMESLGLRPLAFVATDYALSIWSIKKCSNISRLLEIKPLLKNINQLLISTSLIRRHFKEVAIISGLIDKNYPGHRKTERQIKFNSDLVYDVLNKYEKNHVLLTATKFEAMTELVDYDKINDYINDIKKNIVYHDLEKVSPLAVPLILEFNIEKVRGDELLNNLENDINLL
jgi:ATP-dependent Lhr-like helicase